MDTNGNFLQRLTINILEELSSYCVHYLFRIFLRRKRTLFIFEIEGTFVRLYREIFY